MTVAPPPESDQVNSSIRDSGISHYRSLRAVAKDEPRKVVAKHVKKTLEDRSKKSAGDPCKTMKEKLIRANKLKGMSPARSISLKKRRPAAEAAPDTQDHHENVSAVMEVLSDWHKKTSAIDAS